MTSVTNEQLRKLLLRHLPPDEVARMEEAILTEDGVAERLRDEEFDLIDDYVRGKLAETERADMERYVLTTPEHVESVRLARALAAQRPAGEAVSRLRSLGALTSATVQPPRRRNRLLSVGALLAAGLAAVVVIPHWNVDLGRPSTAPRLEGGAASSIEPSVVERGPDQTIVLLADTSRGGPRPMVHLSSDAVSVRVQTEVPGPAKDVSYSMRMDDAAGALIFERHHLSTRVAGPYTFVEAVIPAEVLGSGARTISLAVDGVTSPEYRWQIDVVRDDNSRFNPAT
jgi:hypothetical protein